MTNTLNKERMKTAYRYGSVGKMRCPHENTVNVGSSECDRCPHQVTHNPETALVICAYNENNAVGLSEQVDSPAHYNQGGIECIDAIQAARGDEATKEFCICNAIKYLWRLGHKDEPVQEAKKAVWYINKYIELSEKK